MGQQAQPVTSGEAVVGDDHEGCARREPRSADTRLGRLRVVRVHHVRPSHDRCQRGCDQVGQCRRASRWPTARRMADAVVVFLDTRLRPERDELAAHAVDQGQGARKLERVAFTPPNSPSWPKAVGATWRTRMLVSLLTLGSPEQLSGGYLYHRRLAERAGDHGAEVEFVSVRPWPDPHLLAHGDVVLVDSIAAGSSPRGPAGRQPSSPLAAILHQPPGGIDHSAARRRTQAVLDRNLYRHRAAGRGQRGAPRGSSRLTGCPADHIRVVAPGGDVAALPTGPVPDLRHGRRAAAISVGNWMARKGTLELLDALGRLPDDRVTLHLAGRDDVEPAYTERVRGRLAVLGDRVVHRGVLDRDGIARLYAGADVFVLPSWRNRTARLRRGLAAGLPVVGWRAGDLPHLVSDGVEGGPRPGRRPGLAAALDRLASDELAGRPGPSCGPPRRRAAAMGRHRGSTLRGPQGADGEYSLNDRSTGPCRSTPMRVTPASSTQPPRHPVLDAEGPGDGGLDQADVGYYDHRPSHPQVGGRGQILACHAGPARRAPTAPHPTRRIVGISRHRAHTSVGTDAGRSPRVSRSPARSSGRRPRPPVRAAAVSWARRSGLDTTRSGAGSVAANPAAWVRPRSVNGGSDRPSSRPAAFGAVSP